MLKIEEAMSKRKDEIKNLEKAIASSTSHQKSLMNEVQDRGQEV